MGFFLLTFFILYGALHYYLLVKTKNALALGPAGIICLALFMLIMVLIPLLVYISARYGYTSLARIMSFFGYTWMGLVLFCLFLFFFIDLYRLFLHTGGLVLSKNFSSFRPSPRMAFFIVFFLSFFMTGYGYFEALRIRTEKIVVRTPKIAKEFSGCKIVQISDVHLGLMVREDRLIRIINEVKKASPDILISTGDLLDGQINHLSGLVKILKEVNPRYGKFAVTGNHEFFAGIAQSLEFSQNAGFTMLRGEGSPVAGIINLAGVDDPTGQRMGLTKKVSERELLLRLPRDKFTLLLKHQPVVEKSSLGLFDLQVSGHTHSGQLFPFRIFSRMVYPYNGGFFNLPHNSSLYVSRGSGTWGPPLRFLTPPEVTVFEMVYEEPSEK